MLKYCLQDADQNADNTKGKLVGFMFRLAALTKQHKITALLAMPYLFFYKIFVEWCLGIDVPCTTSIGPGLCIYHGHALVVNKECIIGKNCTLRQSTTIGNAKPKGRSPIIGDNVDIGANVCIIGGITIGSNVVIGAGSIVVKDIPANCVVAGNPARIIKSISTH
jgi:putative colanic acid biosynthesis acetyltransferase WcaB